MPIRSIPLEQKAIGIFQKQRGKLPQSPDEWAVVHRLAYPGGLPEELAKPKESFAAATDTPVAAPPPTPSLPQDVKTSDLGTMKAGVDAAKAKVDALSQPNEAMRILQEAVRAKSGTAEAPLGESAVFQKAGVGGYGALAQSLASRDKEITTNYANFQNAITTMAGTYKDMASTALANYKAAADEYAAEKERLQGILDKQDRHAEEIELLKMRADIDERLKRTPSYSERIAADEAGYEIRGGALVPKGQGVVSGFDITTYATDPQHEAKIAGIVQGIGKFNDISEVDAYIRRKYPNSPITGEMVSKASQKYGVPWEIMVAMMEQDSSMGTAGKGARTFNPGNVGNDDAGNIRNYGNWQAGVDAVASWLDRHRATGTTAKPGEPPVLKEVDGVTKQWDKATGTWVTPTGVEPSGADRPKAADIAKTTEAVKLKGIATLNRAIDDYDALIAEYGMAGTFTPEARRKLNAARETINLAVKDAEALGALQAPDIELIDRMIPDVTSDGFWQNAITGPIGAATGGAKRARNTLKQVKAQYSDKARRNIELLRAQGVPEDDPYLVELARGAGVGTGGRASAPDPLGLRKDASKTDSDPAGLGI